MPTFKELWKRASKKYKPEITNQEFIVIIVSSAVSGGVSFFLSKVNLAQFTFTKIFFLDFIIAALVLSLFIAIIVSTFFKIIRFLNVFGEFLSLAWKEWTFKEEKKEQPK